MFNNKNTLFSRRRLDSASLFRSKGTCASTRFLFRYTEPLLFHKRSGSDSVDGNEKSLTKRSDIFHGSGGWIRTSDQLINSQLRYRCATPEYEF
jgi:hypothetical protein